MRLSQPEDELKPVAMAGSGSRMELNPSQVKVSDLPPETAALPASKPNDVHVQVDAPFVFRANDVHANDLPAPKPVPTREAELLQVRDLPRPASYQVDVLPPPQAQAKPAHHGVFAKIKGFFAGIFS
jgi:hypothetical protein